MSFCKLLLGNLRHFWRTHLGVVLGAACGTAVLVGALAVGDSVRQSLAEQAALRIGRIDAALVAKERFFRADLAERIAQDLEGAAAAPALTFRGICSASGGSSRAGIVDVFGVDERFFALGPRRDKLEEEEKEKSRRGKRQGAKEAKGRQEEEGLPARGKAFLNERLARQLAVDAGDSILLRVEKPSSMPRDLVLATIEDVSLALRVEVERVLSEEEFGRFSLRASQVPPFNLFVSLEWLQSELGLPDRANMLLIGASQSRNDLTRRADRALAMRWTLADAGLELRSLAGSELFELRSERVFLAEPVADAMLEIDARLAGVLGYFVNRLRCGEHATPYSVLAAIGPLSAAPADPALRAMLSLSPRDSATDGIVLNEWLAKDLGAGIGDRVEIDYFVPALRLEEESHAFRVQSVVPIEGPAADPGLMPEFPGLAGSAHCRDWEPGIPIDLDRIRDADERYWDEHRGTPKAFVDLELGQRLWQNRFGQLTAIRGPARLLGRVATELPKKLDPARLGLYFQDLRGSAMAAGSPATDFGGLFLGLSFFLIVAALLLTALLFVFGIEQRASEIGVLLAVGFRPRTARRLFLGEALVLAALGGGLGAFLGIAYTSGVLYGLGTIWRDAVGDASLQLHARPSVIALGTLAAIVAALLAILLAFRKLHERPAVELLQSRGGVAGSPPPSGSVSRYLAIACPILALLLVLMVGTSSAQAAGAFFGAGALLLLGGLSACRLLLTRFATPSPHGIPSVLALGVRNSGRRPSRSLATIALLASGTFLVVAVQAHRLEPPRDVRARASGTGGFALFGRSTLPVLRDLGTATGREAFGLKENELRGVSILPLRVRDGDEASCLNLNLPQNPRLIAVRPGALAERGAFRFAEVLGRGESEPWLLLDQDFGEDVVPAIGDQASVKWTLHQELGGTLDYRDERGRPFEVRIVGTLANSILQGNLIVSEARFLERFPSASGYRKFLIDAPREGEEAVASRLTRALEDIGLELTTTAERLDAFNAVQNSYLMIFQVLGGLGLLLGSVGLGMVVLRNALERRSELAIASAVGYSSRSVRRLVWSEHGLLLFLGLASGVVAALLAVLPGLLGTGAAPSLWPMLLLVVLVALSGAVWVGLASFLATRGPLLAALRSE